MLDLLESINNELEHKVQTLEADRKNLADQVEWQQLEVETKEDELKKHRYQEEVLRQAANTEREKCAAAESRAKSFSEMTELPESVEACCRIFAAAFPDRVEFTERALVSAEKAEYPKLGAVWTALWHMANTLHPLAFGDNDARVDLEDEFRRRSGIELAMSEGKLTKANNKLMQSRLQEHMGEKIDITPHIKLQTGNRHLRIYFHIHRRRRILIVGHCGDHLDTAGTAKRK